MSRALELSHNLFSRIPLAKNGFEVFLMKLGCPSKLYFKGEVVDLADMIRNQYVMRLAKEPEFAKVNLAVSSFIKT